MPKCENCAHLIKRYDAWACSKMKSGYLQTDRVSEDLPCENFTKRSCANCIYWGSVDNLCSFDPALHCEHDTVCIFYKTVDIAYLVEKVDSKDKVIIKEITPSETPLEASEKRSRPDKGAYYLNIAKAVSERSTCLRRQHGAIIVKNDEIISTGYNGSPRGEENCCDCGECYRAKHKIPHGERYEECVAVHAEANAIISASRRDMIGATLYLYGSENGETINAEPCKMCERLIRNAGIDVVVASSEEGD